MTESTWSGGALPYAISSKKLGMWLFIVADSITFGAMLVAYAYLRVASPDWPIPFKFNPSIINATVMTFVLLSSSITMVAAVQAAKEGRVRACVGWMAATMFGGVLFDILHIREWLGLINEGVRLFQNPWGSPLFGATFFAITGMHLLHVIGGVVAIAVIARKFDSGRLTAGHVETVGIYWHFVDLVWMFVVPLVYLLNISR